MHRVLMDISLISRYLEGNLCVLLLGLESQVLGFGLVIVIIISGIYFLSAQVCYFAKPVETDGILFSFWRQK